MDKNQILIVLPKLFLSQQMTTFWTQKCPLNQDNPFIVAAISILQFTASLVENDSAEFLSTLVSTELTEEEAKLIQQRLLLPCQEEDDLKIPALKHPKLYNVGMISKSESGSATNSSIVSGLPNSQVMTATLKSSSENCEAPRESIVPMLLMQTTFDNQQM